MTVTMRFIASISEIAFTRFIGNNRSNRLDVFFYYDWSYHYRTKIIYFQFYFRSKTFSYFSLPPFHVYLTFFSPPLFDGVFCIRSTKKKTAFMVVGRELPRIYYLLFENIFENARATGVKGKTPAIIGNPSANKIETRKIAQLKGASQKMYPFLYYLDRNLTKDSFVWWFLLLGTGRGFFRYFKTKQTRKYKNTWPREMGMTSYFWLMTVIYVPWFDIQILRSRSDVESCLIECFHQLLSISH